MDVINGVAALCWRPVFSRRAVFESAPLVLLCLLPILLYLPTLGAPFERDEGTYATIAQGLLHENVPYRDLFDNKPPLIYGWYAFSFLLFGENIVAPRIIAALLLSATTLAVFGQARMLFTRSAAYVAAGAFAFSTGLPFVALHANTEAYMLLPLVTSLVCFTIGMRRDRLIWFALAGALGGVAVMTKQVAVWNLAALSVMALSWHLRSAVGAWRRVTPLLCLLAGAIAAVALIAGPFIAVGALGNLLYANLSYNWLYMRFLTLGERFGDLAAGLVFVSAIAAPLMLSSALGLLTIVRAQKRSVDYLLVLWALASAIGVATGGRFYPHYFLHLVPAMAMLTAMVAYKRFWRGTSRGIWRLAVALGVPLVALSLVVSGAVYLQPYDAEERVAPTVFQQKEWEKASRALGAYIAERSDPDDTIFNLGREPQIYFYADRRPAVQYFYDWAYQYDPATVSPTIEALRRERPVYIVDSVQPPLFEPAQRPPAFQRLLEENYEYEGRVYFADVYRLKAID